MKAIADTGFLVAFADRRDRYHDWAVALASQVTEPLLSCEAVLAEAAYHLRNTALVLDMVREGLVVPALDLLQELPRLMRLAVRFAERKPDLADLCLVRLSELHPNHSVITVDVADFRVYRRNQRELIPLIGRPAWLDDLGPAPRTGRNTCVTGPPSRPAAAGPGPVPAAAAGPWLRSGGCARG